MSSESDLRNLIEGFRLSCQTENKSPKTIEWYTCFLLRFLQFLQTNNQPTCVKDISKDHIRSFVLHLQQGAKTPHTGQPLSSSTVQGYVRTLKVFYSWLLREEYIDSNPMNRIPVPKAPVRVINTFRNEDISKLITLCHTSNSSGYRNLAIILLLLDSGIRVNELVNIDYSDLDLAEGHIRIRKAKGSKERFVPIGSIVQKALWKYINLYRPQPLTPKITRLFLTEYGLPLTKSGVQQMLRRYGRMAGITGVRCSPHTFRHTFSKYYLLNGGDVFSLQKILGHSSLASVRIYLNLFAEDLKKQHQHFSPVDNLTEIRSIHTHIRPVQHTQ
jgi:integrase/recombinase XerD